jgi:ferredoxin-NADP reductase
MGGILGTVSSASTYSVRLLNDKDVAESTRAFLFEKPEGFVFKAGQFLEITLIDPPETDQEGNTRAFSIASAPHEGTLMVATRMRGSAFKRALGSLSHGRQVTLAGPFGNLVLHNHAARAAVLLAGGIGITPIRSMVLRAARERLPHDIYLFYSNRRPEDAAFLSDLEALPRENPNFRLIATMTAMNRSSRTWSGETGYIDAAMLRRYLKDAQSPIYYVAGPPGMVAGLRTMLSHAGVDDDDIRVEEFSGY